MEMGLPGFLSIAAFIVSVLSLLYAKRQSYFVKKALSMTTVHICQNIILYIKERL